MDSPGSRHSRTVPHPTMQWLAIGNASGPQLNGGSEPEEQSARRWDP